MRVCCRYSVVVNYRSDKLRADEVVEEINGAGGHAIAVYADVSIEEEVLNMFDIMDEKLGSINALVNNAGILGDRNLLPDISIDEIERMLGSNVIGPILCSREAVKRMSTATGGKGSVTNQRACAYDIVE